MAGQGGNDTYIYSSAGGNDIVADSENLKGILQFSDIASTDVSISRPNGGADLVLTVLSTGKTVTVQREYANGGQLKQISFSDGVTWSYAQVQQLLLDVQSAASSGSIWGYGGRDDVLVAGLGDKHMVGNGGNDTYIYSSAGGNDVVTDSENFKGTLEFTDIASTDVVISRPNNGADIVMTVLSTGKTVTVQREFANGGPLKAITFSDGVSWAQQDVLNILAAGPIYGTPGNDSINGTANADTIIGMGGNDILAGGAGGDTYVYAAGAGNDTVSETSSNPGTDNVNLDGLNSSDIAVTHNGNDLLIQIESTGEVLKVTNQFNGTNGVEQITFADSATWDRSQIVDATSAFSWSGSSTNATLTGNALGTNTFSFGDGSEIAYGGARNNVYKVSTATDAAEIDLSTAPGSHNELDFVGGIANTQLWFEQSGNDLAIDLMGTDTSVTVKDWFSGADSQLQEVTAAGLKIDSQISQLVQAMASYTASNPGFDPTSPSNVSVPNDTTLQTALAASWHA